MLAVLCVMNRQEQSEEEEMNADVVETDNEFINEGKLVMGSRAV